MGEKKKKKATNRIEDDGVTRRQVTFSKRSKSLLRKAHKISVLCNADVAFVAFSPSGLAATVFSSGERIEDVLQQYVDLPAYQRYYNLKDVEEKLERLSQLEHIITGEENQSHYLSNQIHHLELQIKKSEVENEILDAKLRDYEVETEQPCSYTLPQLLWCERNLNQALQRVLHRKNLLVSTCSGAPSNSRPFMPQSQRRRAVHEMVDGRPKLDSLSPFCSGGNELNRAITSQFPSHSELIMKLDPWISPYSSKVRNAMLRDIINGAVHPDGRNDSTVTREFGRSSFKPSLHSVEKNTTDFDRSPGLIVTAQCSSDAPELPRDPTHHNGISSEANLGKEGFCSTTTDNQEKEDGLLEWDGFLLAENLNLDDLDIII